MKFEKAYKMVKEYAKSEEATVVSCVDIGDRWVFFWDYGRVVYGTVSASFEKNGDGAYLFTMNSKENRNLVNNGKKVDLPV